MNRTATISRKTNETSIQLTLTLDGSGVLQGSSGIGFLDHMLELWCRQAAFDLHLQMQGDLQVDGHHSVEDLGICLGLALQKALGEKRGIRRYGTAFIPMDETLLQVSLDLSGRSYLVYDAPVKQPRVGDFDTELAEEFFRALAHNALLTLHVRLLYGSNTHHIIEAVFKACGRALREAAALDGDSQAVPSTKGIL